PASSPPPAPPAWPTCWPTSAPSTAASPSCRKARGATRSGWAASTRSRTTTTTCSTASPRPAAPTRRSRRSGGRSRNCGSASSPRPSAPRPRSRRSASPRRWTASSLEDGGVELEADRRGQPQRCAEGNGGAGEILTVADLAVDGDGRALGDGVDQQIDRDAAGGVKRGLLLTVPDR